MNNYPNKRYLDLNGLIRYDELLKEYIPITHGYYNNNNFYSDSELTNLITGEVKRLYVDLINYNIYEYINNSYVQIGGGEGTNVIVSSTPPQNQKPGDIWLSYSSIQN